MPQSSQVGLTIRQKEPTNLETAQHSPFDRRHAEMTDTMARIRNPTPPKPRCFSVVL